MGAVLRAPIPPQPPQAGGPFDNDTPCRLAGYLGLGGAAEEVCRIKHIFKNGVFLSGSSLFVLPSIDRHTNNEAIHINTADFGTDFFLEHF